MHRPVDARKLCCVLLVHRVELLHQLFAGLQQRGLLLVLGLGSGESEFLLLLGGLGCILPFHGLQAFFCLLELLCSFAVCGFFLLQGCGQLLSLGACGCGGLRLLPGCGKLLLQLRDLCRQELLQLLFIGKDGLMFLPFFRGVSLQLHELLL